MIGDIVIDVKLGYIWDIMAYFNDGTRLMVLKCLSTRDGMLTDSEVVTIGFGCYNRHWKGYEIVETKFYERFNKASETMQRIYGVDDSPTARRLYGK